MRNRAGGRAAFVRWRTVLSLARRACVKAQTVCAYAVVGGADLLEHAPALRQPVRLFAQT
eukprot:5966180-Alexandrium_andersonii.AAC.1